MTNVRLLVSLIIASGIFSIFLFGNTLSGFEAVYAESLPVPFVRTANYFLRTVPDINPNTYDVLAAYDLLILPMEAQIYNREFFDYARKKNPYIIILAYVPSRSINIIDIDDGAQIRKKLKNGIQNEWYLRDSRGSIVQAWPGTIPVNVTTEWNAYLPQYVHEVILSTGLWDGIFYDEVQDSMTYLNHGDIDINSDGKPDSKEDADIWWQDGMRILFKHTRERIGEKPIILTNGSSLSAYETYVNGRMFENFPSPRGHGTWLESVKSYLHLDKNNTRQPINIINTTTLNTGNKNDFRTMRFGLASALLANGYFAFDYGDKDHGQLWNYDEYDVQLGKPTGSPENALAGISTNIQEGVWRRDFLQGAVFLNATEHQQTFELEEEFEKIRGSQDPNHNNGSIISEISLDPYDGIILLRPLDAIFDQQFLNGSFAKIFNADGSVKRNGFFAYEQRVRGSAQVIISDAVFVGRKIIISADRGVVSMNFDDGVPIYSFQPFGNDWKFPISLALGKNALYTSLLAVAPAQTNIKKQKHGTSIKIYDLSSGKEQKSFQPFGKTFKGSVSLVFGDIDHDGAEEIIAAAGAGGGPHVRAFHADGTPTKTSFFAYEKKFRGGVAVAVGDVFGTGLPQIITAPGPGRAPEVRVFYFDGKQYGKTFSLSEKNRKDGTRLAVSDIDHDGKDEIITFTANVFTIAGVSQ
ncbi:hypothetical protein HYW94_00935 [Candidatus Uhrbacteria bacterium]|nr:hypothetical protein [Candidatus Uhrbacteria bacterium]